MLHEYMCYHINLCRLYLGGLTRHFGKPTWTKILGCWVQPIVDPLQHHFHSSATSIQNHFTITKLLYGKCIYISSQCTTSLIILGPNLLIFILHNLILGLSCWTFQGNLPSLLNHTIFFSLNMFN